MIELLSWGYYWVYIDVLQFDFIYVKGNRFDMRIGYMDFGSCLLSKVWNFCCWFSKKKFGYQFYFVNFTEFTKQNKPKWS